MIAGVDGCSRGWVAVLCDDDLGRPEARFLEKLADLPRTLRVVAVDVPMGLPEAGDREADRLARLALGEPRRRSVFPCPPRCVLGASGWEEACASSERIDGRRLSKQTFAILPKIAEVDALLRSEEWARRSLYEVHPELSFARWSGVPMRYGKKSPAGRKERHRLIVDLFGSAAFAAAREALCGFGVAPDDLADAFAAVWSARRILTGRAERFPQRRVVDGEGLVMQIRA
jgi:predicted RNase H-like nuclease